YVRQTRGQLFETIERRARENPLQAVAIAAGLAYPALRILRSIPAPIFLIGAGIALAGPAGRMMRRDHGADSQNRAWAPEGTQSGGMFDQARAKMDEATGAVRETTDALKYKARDAASAVQQTVGSAAQQAAEAASRARSTLSAGAESVTSTASQAVAGAADTARRLASTATSALTDTTSAVTDAVSSGYRSSLEASAHAAEQATQAARRAQTNIIDVMERHPLVVGGIGLAIGAIIAAALPATRAENRFLGDTADELKDRARGLASEGYENAKSTAGQLYEETIRKAQQQGLSPDGLREAAQGIGEKLKTVADNVTGGGDGRAGQSGGGQSGGGQPHQAGLNASGSSNRTST
ncbi:MAG TPA: hypothetical protein VGD36_17790, partial [Xanthobacteraceae bacterium]